MVNFQFNLVSMVGIILAVSGAGLYFLRSVRPELTRDYDIFFSAVGLLCGGIFLWQGWRYDPIMQFGQVLLGGSAVFFAFESIRLRGITTVQAKRNTSYVDEDRTVGSYAAQEAELDELGPYEDEYAQYPRISGSREARAARPRGGYGDELEDESRSRRRAAPRPSSSTSGRPRSPSDYPGTDQPPQNRRSQQRPESRRSPAGDEVEASYDRPRRSPPRPANRAGQPSTRPQSGAYGAPEASSRPPQRSAGRPRPQGSRPSPGPTDYVDYQPIDYTDYSDYSDDQEADNANNFDGQ
jgi:hypothetical protein